MSGIGIVHNRTPKVEVIRVIEVRFLRGSGVKPDPVREIVALFREDGTPIVELDPSMAGEGIGGTVRQAGGGEVTVLVDRDTADYPVIGSHVILNVP